MKKQTPDSLPPTERPFWLLRLWLAIPERVLNVAGAVFPLAGVAWSLRDYADFWNAGPTYTFADGHTLHMPFVRILADATVIPVALGSLFRRRSLARNRRGSDILIAFIGTYWLLIPFLIRLGCGLFDAIQGTHWEQAFQHYWWSDSLSLGRTITGVALASIGHALDVWGYTALLPAFSIVPEARVLRVVGPYRFVRHPVYLGHFFAQAGNYLCFAAPHLIWTFFWAGFVALQILRTYLEERVLAAAFGRPYQEWRRRTFWFWRGERVPEKPSVETPETSAV